MSNLKMTFRSDKPMDWSKWRKVAEDVVEGRTDHYEPPESPKMKDWLELLNERDRLQQSLVDLIAWIDERKFEQIHKFCGCTYCNARAVIGKQ